MKFPLALLLAAVAIAFAACSDAPAAAGPNSVAIVADQQYYPVEQGTFWLYRFDTTGVTGPTVKDVYRRKSVMKGVYNFNGVVYAVQENETTRGIDVTFDTVFVRKDESGVYATSFALQTASLFPGIGGLPITIPKEILLIPANAQQGQTWDLFTFEYSPIPFLQFYIRTKANFQGIETVPTDTRLYKQCARIRITLEARLPNPENPTDFLNPLRISENGSFWFTRPGGLVAGDGAQLIFDILDGNFVSFFARPERRVHQELMTSDIVQPDDPCVYR